MARIGESFQEASELPRLAASAVARDAKDRLVRQPIRRRPHVHVLAVSKPAQSSPRECLHRLRKNSHSAQPVRTQPRLSQKAVNGGGIEAGLALAQPFDEQSDQPFADLPLVPKVRREFPQESLDRGRPQVTRLAKLEFEPLQEMKQVRFFIGS